MVKNRFLAVVPVLFAVTFFGCARSKDLEMVSREQARVIADLNAENAALKERLDRLKESKGDLERAKAELEKRLKSELAGGDLSLAMGERGLIVTLPDRVLFDSGQAELKESAKATLDQLAAVLQSKVPQHIVYVEGHTDNDPIVRSNWRSNWELSTARSTEVIHYFIEYQGLNPTRFAATGFSQYQPLVSNDSYEGKAKNRRVEIVISPKTLKEFGSRQLLGM